MLAVISAALVIISYTSVGGFSAVATMGPHPVHHMTVALVVITVFSINQAGGVDAVVENAKSMDGYLSFFQTYDPVAGSAKPYPAINIFSMLAWGLGYFGMPHILVRFMAIRDEKELTLSRRIAAVWVVISMTVAVCIGMIGNSVSKAGHIPTLEGSASETIIVQIANCSLPTAGWPPLSPVSFWPVSWPLPCPPPTPSFWQPPPRSRRTCSRMCSA